MKAIFHHVQFFGKGSFPKFKPTANHFVRQKAIKKKLLKSDIETCKIMKTLQVSSPE